MDHWKGTMWTTADTRSCETSHHTNLDTWHIDNNKNTNTSQCNNSSRCLCSALECSIESTMDTRTHARVPMAQFAWSRSDSDSDSDSDHARDVGVNVQQMLIRNGRFSNSRPTMTSQLFVASMIRWRSVIFCLHPATSSQFHRPRFRPTHKKLVRSNIQNDRRLQHRSL
jgi:hypothetical protein